MCLQFFRKRNICVCILFILVPKWLRGVTVTAMNFYPGDRGSIHRQVEMFINLKCSFRRLDLGKVSTREGLLPRGTAATMCQMLCAVLAEQYT